MMAPHLLLFHTRILPSVDGADREAAARGWEDWKLTGAAANVYTKFKS